MKLSLVVKDQYANAEYEIAPLVTGISLSTRMDGQPGSLSFDLIPNGKVSFFEGGQVRLVVDDRFSLFLGTVFSKSRSALDRVRAVCYDQMRYLANRDSYVLPEMTSGAVFRRICSDTGLPFRIVHDSAYHLPACVMDGRSYHEILSQALSQTTEATGERFFIRDEFGTLLHANAKALDSGVLLTDSQITQFDYASSIADDTFNRVKIVRDGFSGKARQVYETADARTTALWGRLQYYERVDRDMTLAQMKQKAGDILTRKNRVSRTLQLSARSDLRVFAGSLVHLRLSSLGEFSPNAAFLVNTCTHRFSNGGAVMTLDVDLEGL